jgi:hypothetical protein
MYNIQKIEPEIHVRKPVLWIRSGFKADPDPAFFVNADPDTDLDSDPGFW